MNVVSIMAHQDDEMRCLGTMLKCRARGDQLFFVTLTDGTKGFVQNPHIDPAEAARIRHAEMTSRRRRRRRGVHQPAREGRVPLRHAARCG